jgi:hypothetical protein
MFVWIRIRSSREHAKFEVRKQPNLARAIEMILHARVSVKGISELTAKLS